MKRGVMNSIITNVLDMNAYLRSHADDTLSVDLSTVIGTLFDLELDTYTPQSKRQALIHLLEARDLLSK